SLRGRATARTLPHGGRPARSARRRRETHAGLRRAASRARRSRCAPRSPASRRRTGRACRPRSRRWREEREFLLRKEKETPKKRTKKHRKERPHRERGIVLGLPLSRVEDRSAAREARP